MNWNENESITENAYRNNVKYADARRFMRENKLTAVAFVKVKRSAERYVPFEQDAMATPKECAALQFGYSWDVPDVVI